LNSFRHLITLHHHLHDHLPIINCASTFPIVSNQSAASRFNFDFEIAFKKRNLARESFEANHRPYTKRLFGSNQSIDSHTIALTFSKKRRLRALSGLSSARQRLILRPLLKRQVQVVRGSR
jgi:hypothetical protein